MEVGSRTSSLRWEENLSTEEGQETSGNPYERHRPRRTSSSNIEHFFQILYMVSIIILLQILLKIIMKIWGTTIIDTRMKHISWHEIKKLRRTSLVDSLRYSPIKTSINKLKVQRIFLWIFLFFVVSVSNILITKIIQIIRNSFGREMWNITTRNVHLGVQVHRVNMILEMSSKFVLQPLWVWVYVWRLPSHKGCWPLPLYYSESNVDVQKIFISKISKFSISQNPDLGFLENVQNTCNLESSYSYKYP